MSAGVRGTTRHSEAHRGLILVSVLILLASMVGPIQPALRTSLAAESPTVRLDDSTALPGEKVVVDGEEFPEDAEGTLVWDEDQTVLATFETDDSGDFEATFTAPAVAAGSYEISARVAEESDEPEELATAEIAIEAPATPTGAAVPPTETATAVPPTLTSTAQPATETPEPPTETPEPATETSTARPTERSVTESPSATPTEEVSSARIAAAGTASPPIRATFYYPWFPNAWQQGSVYPYTNFTPSAGYYDGADPAVIASQIDAMQYGGIEAGISSWWGPGHHTDQRLPALFAAAQGTGFKWTVYHEAEAYGNPSVSEIRSDLTYLRDTYADDPAYLRIDGKFVVFVYADSSDGCGMADRWADANTVGAYVVLKVFSGYKTCGSQPESWHQYAPSSAAQSHGVYSYSISPGFWLKGSSQRLARDTDRFAQNVRDMVASGASWQLVVSFNEWGEGTAVESAEEWRSASGYGAYLDILHTDGQGSLPGPADLESPTSSPAATRTATPAVGTGSITLSTAKSKYNSVVGVALAGFAPNRAVTVRWPDGTTLATVTAGADGAAETSFRTPLAPYGDYRVEARDAAGRTAVALLTVIPRTKVTPTSGAAGSQTRVYLYGYSPNEQVEVRWYETTTSSRVLRTLTVEADGRATGLVTIPAGAVAGGHKVAGKVVGVARSSSTTFTVTAGVATATPTATRAATSTPTSGDPRPAAGDDALVVIPAADARVEELFPTTTFGSNSTLQVDGGSGVEKRSYLKFSLDGLPGTVTAAKLQLYVRSGTENGPKVQRASNSWEESRITWATRPSLTGSSGEDKGALREGTWIEYDVTSLVSGDGDHTFALLPTSTDGVTFAARDDAQRRPVLILTVAGSLQPTPTPVQGGEAVLLAAGDIADCGSSGDEATAKLLDGLDGTIAALGDSVYTSGTASEFANCYDPSWGRHKGRTRPAVGNHEYGTSGASGYFNYFGSAAGNPSKGYYSYDLGAWHIVVLNSNCSKIGGCGSGSPQASWLEADLAAHRTDCTLAYWHHPLFSSGNHGNDPVTKPLWEILYADGADVVLSGHDHDYERFAPQTADGSLDRTHGIREFVVGTGGKNLYGFGTARANSEIRYNKGFGVLRLRLRDGSYAWDFVSEAGKTFTDSGTGQCHGAPTSGGVSAAPHLARAFAARPDQAAYIGDNGSRRAHRGRAATLRSRAA